MISILLIKYTLFKCTSTNVQTNSEKTNLITALYLALEIK